LLLAAPAPENREASPIALVLVLLLLVALIFLIRSMNKHLRKVPDSFSRSESRDGLLRDPADRAPVDLGPADRAPADRAPVDLGPADRAPADLGAAEPADRTQADRAAAETDDRQS
jgi:hypothetical protein